MLTIQQVIKMLKHLKSNEIVKILSKTTTVAIGSKTTKTAIAATTTTTTTAPSVTALERTEAVLLEGESCSQEHFETSNDSPTLLTAIQSCQKISTITSPAATQKLPKQQTSEQQLHPQQQQLQQQYEHHQQQHKLTEDFIQKNNQSSYELQPQHHQQQQQQRQQQETESSQQTNSFSFTLNLDGNGCVLTLTGSEADNSTLLNQITSTQDLNSDSNLNLENNFATNLNENKFVTFLKPKTEKFSTSKSLLTAGLASSSLASASSSLSSPAPSPSPSTSSNPFYLHQQRSQRIQNFYQQQLHHFHTQHNQSLWAKQKLTKFAMSSLAAEPLTSLKQDEFNDFDTLQQQKQQIQQEQHQHQHQQQQIQQTKQNNGTCHSCSDSTNLTSSTKDQSSSAADATGKPCFNTGLAEIIKFMELIGNLKHTKRTGWVLRDVNDCESISGHMYRMSILTFLLDGTEGLNQIRCMELALVHDMAESLVGDITPFCGITKDEKRAMEFKAMEDICNLIQPRGKRIMELFEEYENGESPESKFVKDLDRLDMVMQAYEYEKRDNCLLKHQEFFDSTRGKFNHPFVKKLVNEIYDQRDRLAEAAGATPPPTVLVPDMAATTNKLNGHSIEPKTTNGSSS